MRLWSDLLDLVLPQRCAGCAAARALLCEDCLRSLDRPARLSPPTPAPAGLPPVWAGPVYEGPVRSMIVAYKESGRTALARPLGAALARHVMAAAPPTPIPPTPIGGTLLLVPAPSARSAVRRRGHDAARALAAAAAATLGRLGVAARCAPALAQSRRVADQAGLSAADRIANLRGALVVTAPDAVRGRDVIVVDDVITNGATLAEAARALSAAGARVRGAAVVAATPRRHGRRGVGPR